MRLHSSNVAHCFCFTTKSPNFYYCVHRKRQGGFLLASYPIRNNSFSPLFFSKESTRFYLGEEEERKAEQSPVRLSHNMSVTMALFHSHTLPSTQEGLHQPFQFVIPSLYPPNHFQVRNYSQALHLTPVSCRSNTNNNNKILQASQSSAFSLDPTFNLATVPLRQ